MNRNRESQARLEGREMIVSRIIDAPRALVWKAWTDPAHLTQWWGPDGFTTTTHAFDFRSGGEWRHTMHGPDGTDYPNRCRFLEVVAPERLDYLHDSGTEEDGEGFRTSVTFRDLGGATEVVMVGTFPSPEACRLVAEKHGAIEGGKQTLGRLADHVAFLEGPCLVLTRTFEAPRELVWKAWTEAERLARWWGPAGMAVRVASLDLRPGGRFHYAMTTPEGATMWGKFHYREILPPSRLSFTVSFSDADGGTTRHPMSATWPLVMLNRLTLQEAAGRTTLTLESVPLDANAVERGTFEAGFTSMQHGWKGTLDSLETYLTRA